MGEARAAPSRRRRDAVGLEPRRPAVLHLVVQQSDPEQIGGAIDSRVGAEEAAARNRRPRRPQEGLDPCAGNRLRPPMDDHIHVALGQIGRRQADGDLIVEIRMCGLKVVHARQ